MPTQSAKAAARFSFETRLRLYAALLCLLPLPLLGMLLYVEHASLAGAAGLLVLTALVLLISFSLFVDYAVRPLQTLANVVAALREEDYSFRARGASSGDAFGELAMEVNSLADMLQAQRQAALEATALLRRVIAEMDAPVLAFDQQERLRLVNPAAERVFGLSAARDLGLPARELGLTSLLVMKQHGLLDLAGAGTRPGESPEAGNPEGKSQGRWPARWMVRRSTFRQRGVPHVLLLLSDVSTALREEERLAWRRLIRVLGHEINNSLAPIKSIAGSLRARIPQQESAEDLARGLGIIETRAESLNRFVQAYRQLAQLPAPAPRPVSLAPLLERITRLETRLTVELGPVPDAILLADPDQLEQLLINLIRNAVEAAMSMAEESAGAPAPQVRLHALVEPNAARLFIEDNGPGISNPANLFVPFYTTKKTGTGVGLALVRQIAEAHGGTVELRNRAEASGCIAEVTLPIARPGPE